MLKEERDARARELAEQLTVDSFKETLVDPTKRAKADRLLDRFEKGKLSYKEYKALPLVVRKMYVSTHGSRPLTENEKTEKRNKKSKNRRQTAIAKESRRRNKQ